MAFSIWVSSRSSATHLLGGLHLRQHDAVEVGAGALDDLDHVGVGPLRGPVVDPDGADLAAPAALVQRGDDVLAGAPPWRAARPRPRGRGRPGRRAAPGPCRSSWCSSPGTARFERRGRSGRAAGCGGHGRRLPTPVVTRHRAPPVTLATRLPAAATVTSRARPGGGRTRLAGVSEPRARRRQRPRPRRRPPWAATRSGPDQPAAGAAGGGGDEVRAALGRRPRRPCLAGLARLGRRHGVRRERPRRAGPARGCPRRWSWSCAARTPADGCSGSRPAREPLTTRGRQLGAGDTALKAARLNAPAGDVVGRWAAEATVTALVAPLVHPLEGPGALRRRLRCAPRRRRRAATTAHLAPVAPQGPTAPPSGHRAEPATPQLTRRANLSA